MLTAKKDANVVAGKFSSLKNRYDAVSKTHDQLRYLSQSVELEEAVHPQIVRFTMVTISASLFVFLIWAGFAKINEVARAAGEIVPAGFVQTVEQYDGGIVKQILVKEGQLVDKGQLLVVVDGTGAGQDLAETEAKQEALTTEAARLTAVVQYAEGDKADVKLTAEQKQIYDSMIAAHEGERDVIKNQIAQKTEAISVLKSQRATLARNVSLTSETYASYTELYKEQLLSKVRYIQVQKDLNEYQGELAKVDNEIRQGEQEIAEYNSRLVSLEATHVDNARQQLEKLNSEIAQNNEILTKLQAKVDRLEIRSPVKGLVKGLTVNTIGGIIRPGEPLMEIVPLGEKLVVEAKIDPKYIGHIKINQPVQVKVSSYDYARYGAIPGHVESISAITFAGTNGEKYYRGRILLDQNHVGHNAANNIIMPGMTVEADIITGEKSILAYLLKPIQVSLQTALTEK